MLDEDVKSPYVPAHAAPSRTGRRVLALAVVLLLVAGGLTAYLARRGSTGDNEKALRHHIPVAFLATCNSESPDNVPGATARLTCGYKNNKLDYYLFPRLGALINYFDAYKARKHVTPGTCPDISPTAKVDEAYIQHPRSGDKSPVNGDLLCVHGVTNAHLAWSQPDQLIFATAYGNAHDMSGHCAQSQAWHHDDFGPRANPLVRVDRKDAANQDPAATCAKDMNGKKSTGTM